MKKYFKWIVGAVIFLLIVLVCILYFGNIKGEYLFSGSLINETDNIKVNVFVMRNNNGNLLNYFTDINYTNENIVAGRLFYYKNKEKNVILGNSLNSYDYSRKKENKKEYGADYIDVMLENNLYFDLCLDTSCDNVYETIKLKYSELN